MKQVNWIEITRWSARMVSVLLLVLVLVIFFGEGPPAFASLTATELLMMFFFWLMAAGLVWAWWHPMAGGALTLLAFLFFAGVNLVSSGSLPNGWVFPLFPLNGALHLVYGFQRYCCRRFENQP